MKKSKFNEQQIVSILKEQESGVSVKDVCRKYGMSEPTYYKWRSKYGGMESSDVKKMRDLEEENTRLKKMYADLALDHTILKDIVSKKW
jgi:putative transposase